MDWIICKEYLGSGDGSALNLFRLCLDIRTGFSYKIRPPKPRRGVGGREARTQGLAPK